MKPQVELIPLLCINCETPVPAETDQVAWACSQCGQGLLLDLENGLHPLEIHYASGVGSNNSGKPFWLASVQVTMEREAEGGWLDRSERQSDRFWQGKKEFYIPANTSSLDDLLEQARQMLIQPPDLNEGPRVPFEPVRLSPGDLPALVEFVILGIEAGRKDKIKSLDISVELDTPQLWILP
jgi:hypothetical protein